MNHYLRWLRGVGGGGGGESQTFLETDGDV